MPLQTRFSNSRYGIKQGLKMFSFREAISLYSALLAGRRAVMEDHQHDPTSVKAAMTEVVARQPRFTLDYAEVVAATDLNPIAPLAGEVRLLIAARLGKARLIDNVGAHV